VITTYIYSTGTNNLKRVTEQIPSKGVNVPTDYDYYSDNSIKTISTPSVKYTYSYYDGLLSDKVKKVEIEKNLEDGSTENSWIEYEYDEEGSLVSKKDNLGVVVKYSYSTQNNFPVEEVQCSDANCLQASVVSTTNDYSRLDTKTINNFKIKSNYGSDGSFRNFDQLDLEGNSIETFTPTEQYTAGLLSQDDEYKYTYDAQNRLSTIKILDTVTEDNPDGLVATFQYDSEDRIEKISYSNGASEKLYRNFAGEIIYNEYTVASSSTSYGYTTTGAIIRNFFLNFFLSITGNVVNTGVEQNNDGTITYGYVSTLPGEYLSLEDHNKLTSNFLAKEGVIVSNISLECMDFDVYLGSKNSLFNSSYVWLDGKYNYDYCLDDNTIKEYYCGISLFVNGFNEVVKSKDYSCDYGCENGACLEEEIVIPIEKNESIIIPPVNETDSDNQTSDLPVEPSSNPREI
jgi:YD repeat-containing protein